MKTNVCLEGRKSILKMMAAFEKQKLSDFQKQFLPSEPLVCYTRLSSS